MSMTGEITLQGKVLPVGGIKEKVLAAKRAGIKEVILPQQNEKNVKEDLGEELMKGLTIHLVNTIDEVLLLALVHETDRPAQARAEARQAGARAPIGDQGRSDKVSPASVFRSTISPDSTSARASLSVKVRGSISSSSSFRAVESGAGGRKILAAVIDHLFVAEPGVG